MSNLRQLDPRFKISSSKTKKAFETIACGDTFKSFIGRANSSIGASSLPVDYIEIFDLTTQGIFEKAADLYRSGASLREVANDLGFSKTKIRQTLKNGGVELAPTNGGSKFNSLRSTCRHVGNVPFGYIRLEGRLVEDPREQYVVQKILNLAASGLNPSVIAKKLNELKVRPRRSNLWDHSSVRSVLNRHQLKKGGHHGTR